MSRRPGCFGARLALLPLALASVAPATPDRSEPPAGGATAATRAVPPTGARPVSILASPPDSALVPLLRAELNELGLTVTTEPATASIRIVVTPTRLEVWIADETTGRVTLHEVFAQSDGAPLEPRTAVLHAVELLRWALRGEPPGLDPTLTPAPPDAAAAPAPPARVLDLRVSALGLAVLSPGGTTAGGGGELDGLARQGHAGLRLLGATVVVPERVTRAVGSAEIRPSLWGLEAVWLPAPLHRRWFAELGLGTALLHAKLDGESTGDYVGHTDHLLTAAPLADARVGGRLSERLSLVASATLLVPLRSDRVRFAGVEVARYGEALSTLGLGVELTLP